MRISQVAILLHFLLLSGFSQDGYLRKKVPEAELFTIENGLSQTRVNTSFIDSYGFLWIGTSDGLNRFDGYGFEGYKHTPYDTTSLSHNFVRCIAEDNNANLWIGTDFGLNLYDRNSGEFRQYLHNPNDASTISGHKIVALYADKNGFVWIKTEKFLDRLDLNNDSILHFRHYVNSFNNNPVNQNCPIIEDRNGLIWFGSNDGLFSFNTGKGSFTHYFNNPGLKESISDNIILSIYQDAIGELWIGTKNGLNKFNRLNNSFSRYLHNQKNPANNELAGINAICQSPDGKLWLGTNKGLIVYDKADASTENVSSLYINNSLFSIGTVTGLVIDNSGIIWVSGFQGLFKIDTKPKKFTVYNSSQNSFPAMSGDMISCIYKETDDLIWIGVLDYGLNILNRKTGEVQKYYQENANHLKRISSNTARCIFRDRYGIIWLGSNNGIDIFDPVSRTFTSFEKKYPSVSSRILKNRRVYCIIEDVTGDIWIGTDKGVLRFQRKFNLLTSYNKIYRNNLTAGMGFVFALAHDKENKIWIGTENGLNCYDQGKDLFYRYEETGNKPDLSSGIIYSLLIDSDNTLWVGTSSGLNRFNPAEDNFEVFTEENGLSNNIINAILEDDSQCLWLSTNKGLSSYNISGNEFTNFDPTAGLQSYEFNHSVASKANDGELFFGGISGFNSFYPQSLPMNPHIPRVVFTSFEIIDSKGLKHKSKGEKNVREIENKQSFIVEFAALDFTMPASNTFEYSMQVKGKGDKWVPLENQNSVTFYNLPSGEYILKVKGSNSDRVWNTEGAEITIISVAPFWRTRPAFYAYLIISILLIYLLIRFNTKSLRKSNRILRDRDIAAKEISRQKDMLVLRNKNIEDSLNYAQRIQKAMLTTSKQFHTILPDSFVLHKPKDIVSGDFYWISEQEGKIFVAAADCTGHGVPGAFMSLISLELFRKIIKSQNVYDPALILDTMNRNFEEIFGNIEDIAIKDGMDLSFCVFDKKMTKLEFSGAFNPLYIVRDSRLIELKGDRFSIGADLDSDSPRKAFTNHTFMLKPNDMIYMFSDGYADQFGGVEGKKYKYRRFRHLLLNIHHLPLNNQRQIIDENFEVWKGNTEQIDDVLVIGIRV